MTVFRPPSLVSSSQSHSTSQYTGYTTTTASFEPGPGALTGKAINALGKLTIRGIDRIIIFARLRSIASKLPHSEDARVDHTYNMERLYDVLLELCRPGIYNDGLHEKAMGLLMMQIRSGNFRHLIKALASWHISEVQLLLPEIARSLSPLGNVEWGRQHLPKKYQKHVLPDLTTVVPDHRISLAEKEVILQAKRQDTSTLIRHEVKILLLISFFSQLCEEKKEMFRAVLDAGYLDLVLFVQKENLLLTNFEEMETPLMRQPRLLDNQESREKLLTLIFLGIRNNRTAHIVDAISQWDIIDVRTLLFELHEVSNSAEPGPDVHGETHRTKVERFFSRISSLNPPGTCKAALDAGFLDMVQYIDYEEYGAEDDEYEVCRSLMEILKPEYNEVHRLKAAKLIIPRFGQHKRSLTSALSLWNVEDIASVTRLLQDVLFDPQRGYQPRQSVYKWIEIETATSIISFLCGIANISEDVRHAVIGKALLEQLNFGLEHNISIDALDKEFNTMLHVLRCNTSHCKPHRRKFISILLHEICRGNWASLARHFNKMDSSAQSQVLQEIVEEFECLIDATENILLPHKCSNFISFLKRLLSNRRKEPLEHECDKKIAKVVMKLFMKRASKSVGQKALAFLSNQVHWTNIPLGPRKKFKRNLWSEQINYTILTTEDEDTMHFCIHKDPS